MVSAFQVPSAITPKVTILVEPVQLGTYPAVGSLIHSLVTNTLSSPLVMSAISLPVPDNSGIPLFICVNKPVALSINTPLVFETI